MADLGPGMSQQSWEPDHADYRVLDQIILEHFAVAPNEEGFDVNEALRPVIDPRSAATSAMGRAMAFLGIDNPAEMQARQAEVLRLAMFWTEGLHAGILFEKERES